MIRPFKIMTIAASVCAIISAPICSEISYATENDEQNLQSEAAESDEEYVIIGGGYAVTGQIDDVGYTTIMYDAQNGLPTSDANYILGASDGYIYVGGYSGVFKYNGATFEQIDTSYGLTSARGLFEDSQNRIWVGTNDNGVVVIDDDKQIHITYEDGLTSSSIRTFAEDDYGNVFIGTTAGVCYADENLSIHQIDDARLNQKRVLKLETDTAGTIYGQTRDGDIFTIENEKLTSFYSSEDLQMGVITSLLTDPEKEGYLYITTESDTIYYGKYASVASDMEKIKTDPLNGVHWISYDCERVWVSSTDAAGYLDENNKFHLLKHSPLGSGIEMMTSDYQGNMWYASSTQGVMKVVMSNFLDVTSPVGLDDVVINTTCLYNGMLYVGTDEGVYILNSNDEIVSDKLTKKIGYARVRCIMRDANDNLWISTYTEDLGLICYSKDGKIKSYTTDNGLPSDEVRGTYLSEDGSVLVGTNGGLAIIKEQKITNVYGASDVIKNTVFLSVCEDEDGKIYASSDGDGIYVITQDGVEKIGRQDGLTSDVTMRIKKDPDEDIVWFVTSNSLCYMKDDKITTVTSFPSTNNYDVFFAKDGTMWVISSFGVYAVDKEQVLNDNVSEYRLYTLANGISSLPTSNLYCELDDEGNLYIAGRSSVSKVNIDNFFTGVNLPIVDINYITGDNEEIVQNDEGVYVIGSDISRIQISTAVLDYTLTDPIVRIYLEGSNDNGITARASMLSSLEFTELDYGDYTFHIQILDNSQDEIYKDVTFKLQKNARIFELRVTKILLIVLIAAAVGFIVYRVLTGTVIRRQYVEIKQAKEEAESASLAKTRFLANMSHEIRTPINTIMGMDEMILREDADNVPKAYYMSVVNYALDIKDASESLLGLINDLLDMSKVESGKMHLVEREYNTEDLLRSMVSMIRVRASQKDLTFEVDVDEMMPKRLYGDDGKIKQVCLNLLTNAVKYTERGGFSLRVWLEKIEDDICDIRICVKDSGIGVKPEDMDKLFTAYERLDEEKNSGIQGTGLGLDISRRFADLMGGSLTCNSVYGEGSEFIFTFSQKVIEQSGIGVFKEHDEDKSEGPYIPQFIAPDADILVVDDNPMNLSVIKGLLKATQMFVTTASSGEECLDKLKYEKYNVVLLDHMMPGMDGIETVAEIRKDFPDLPVYALTANATAGEEYYKSVGFNGYLSKPIDSLTLEKTIMKHLPEEIMKKGEATDAIEDLESLPEEVAFLEDVDGIVFEEGVKNSGGIKPFISAVEMFYDTIEGNADVIEKAYNEEDIKLYTIKVHSLKSSARIIGAIELSELARKLEDAGNNNDKGFIGDNTNKLLSDYRAYHDKLSKIKKPLEKKDAPMISDEELLDAYSALAEVIPQMDYDAVEMIIEQVNENALKPEDEEIMNQLASMLKLFEWDKMEELIKDRNTRG